MIKNHLPSSIRVAIYGKKGEGEGGGGGGGGEIGEGEGGGGGTKTVMERITEKRMRDFYETHVRIDPPQCFANPLKEIERGSSWGASGIEVILIF